MDFASTLSSLISFFAALPRETQAFIGAIVLLTVIFHLKYTEKTVAYGPTILTTTGIFATFIGIALGLSKFNEADIQASVPALLAGLKTAFWASVAGVGGALTLKFRHYFAGIRQEIPGSGADGEVTISDLAKSLNGIQQALIGSDDATLISQLKLIRSDSNERLDGIKKSQTEALQKLSEMGSKALVEALRDVIHDFNAKITEQFGDNFKQLNAAVSDLLVWQNQYKQHVESTAAHLETVIGLLTTATGDYQRLVQESGVFTATARDLSSTVATLEVQKQQLTTALQSLAQLLIKASDGLPQVEAKVTELTAQIGRSVEANQKEVNRALADNVQLIRTSLQGTGQELGKINQEFNKQLGDLAERTNRQVTVLDAALSEELKKSLESLGRQLTALSEKFVADYTPLTDRLRAVVNMAPRQ